MGRTQRTLETALVAFAVFWLAQPAVAGADTEAPRVVITNPAAGTIYTSATIVTITASATDDIGVTGVAFYDNGRLKSWDLSAPYTHTWLAGTRANGSHGWSARALDAAGNSTESAVVSVLVDIGGSDAGPPAVSISSPTAGSTFTSAQIVTIAAAASDDVGVTKVEFYDGGTLKGTDTSAPYHHDWQLTDAENGVHAWTAKAYDAAGKNALSDPVSVTVNIPVVDTTPPTVSITSPTSGTTYTDAQAVTIVATASDNVGVAEVEFYDGGVLKGTDTDAPYQYGWAITAGHNGLHAWTAKARDAAGQSALSSAVFVTVDIPVADTTPPTVSIASPASGTTYLVAQTVTIVAMASDNVGVAEVEFYDGGVLKGTDTDAPYQYDWAITAGHNGLHTWTAKARDAAGQSALSSPVSVMVDIPVVDTTPPTVSLSSPASGSTFTRSQTVTIAATASDDVGVTKVEFYDGGVLKGSDSAAPYHYDWAITAAQNGAHTWTAKAYDDAGNTGVSASPVSLTVSVAVSGHFDLVGTIPLAGTARDVTLDEVAGYAYVASDEFGLTIVDVTDPRNPVAKGAVLPSFTGANVAVGDGVAVVTSGEGLFVIDVSDPVAPATIGSIEGKIISGVAKAGDFAYARINVPGNPSHTDLAVVDLSVPEAPQIVRQIFLSGGDEVELVGSLLYVTTQTELKIFDVSDARVPVQIGAVEVPDGARELAVEDGYAYVGNGSWVRIIDVRTPSAPAIVGAMRAGPTALQVAGNRLYLLIGSLLAIVDVSDPTAPVLLGTGDGFNAWGIDVVGGTAFLASPDVDFAARSGGLYVVDVSVPEAPGVLGQLPAGVGNSAIAVAGSLAAVGTLDGMRVVDVSDPFLPATIGVLDGAMVAGLAMAGDFAYARVNIAGNPSHMDLAVVDLSVPEAPQIVQQIFLPDGDEVEVIGSYAYVTTQTELKIFDVGDPYAPRLLGSLEVPDGVRELAVGTGYAYVGNLKALHIIDVRTPSAPVIVGSLRAAPVDLAVEGSRLYLAVGSVLGIVDISDPTAPAVLGMATGLDAFSIKVVGATVFMASPSAGVSIIDAGDATQPRLVQQVRVPGPARSVAAADGFLYVGDDSGTLDICLLGGP